MGLFSRKKKPEPVVEEMDPTIDKDEIHALRAKGLDYTRGMIKLLKRRMQDPKFKGKHKYYAAKKKALEGLL